jgi:3-oxoadipate enol-lactonase
VPLLEVNDQPIHVIDRGSGDAVAFLHAFPLQAAMWDYQLEAFESTHRCVAIDMPGFGQSPSPVDPDASSMHWAAGLVAGALDQLDIDQATIVGASMGGYLAMSLLRHHPERVREVVLADTRARSDDPQVAKRRGEQQDQLRGGAEVGSLAKSVVEGLLSSGSMARAELVDYVHALAEAATPAGWIGALEAMKSRPDNMLVLRQADVRALVIVGELDRVTPIAEAMSVRSLVKGELVVIPGVGHLPNVEDPLAFNEALAGFLGVTAGDGHEVDDAVEPAAAAAGVPEADTALDATG